jgi:hypothetical protein
VRRGRDPFWRVARGDGIDARGTPYKRGDRVFYYPNDNTTLAGEHAQKASRDFEALRSDEELWSRGL